MSATSIMSFFAGVFIVGALIFYILFNLVQATEARTDAYNTLLNTSDTSNSVAIATTTP